jgi:uncharacterized protein YehS (DUF1456 family)
MILFKIKNALDLDNAMTLKIFGLADVDIDEAHLENILKKHSQDGYAICGYDKLGGFLDGLILSKRGSGSHKDNEAEIECTHNLILKKLRIALNLKEADMLDIFALSGHNIKKNELSALFRSESSHRYKSCDDDTLHAFLAGLDAFYHRDPHP